MVFKLAQCGRFAVRRFNSRVLYVPSSGLRTKVIASSFAARPSVEGLFRSLSLSNSYATTAAKPKTKAEKTVKKKKKASKKPTPPPKRGRPGKSNKEKRAEEKKKEAKVRAREDLENLKEAALTPPKPLPTSKIAIFSSGKGPLAESVKAFKEISQFHVDELGQTAEKNAETNRHNLEQWIESHTPLEIKNANAARRKLRRILPKKSRIYGPIKDYRQVKGPRNAYLLYSLDMHNSGELRHLSAKERIAETARSWKNASESEKEKYKSLQEEDRKRYINEYKSTYGEEPKLVESSDAEDL
ncbi:TPA_exp: putative HMG box protein [Trichophyton benhamiae CBS 112371]|uniref:HMG box protein, putative n=1 Tax=Arthroderma benhamiae (strain ATCC MYA-4681 / CBS 112371) TaxID=663331 RepID=D4AWA5_ARTBC|nr:HMG box protein, putative [Trichophyton benhamiae CBS 112371]EFE32645.1 HMG box protein, putative [Trichophyton benhamiae CBS 112371]DAA75728.1 TPA_exp: putative HMG box protein [Trichophyton benhamiae CBS 112371]